MNVYVPMREEGFFHFTTRQTYGAEKMLFFGWLFACMIPLNVLARRRCYSSMSTHMIYPQRTQSQGHPPLYACMPIKKSKNIVYNHLNILQTSSTLFPYLGIQSPLSSIHNLLDLLHTLINDLFHLCARLFQIIRSSRLCQLHCPQLLLLSLSGIPDCIVGHITCLLCCIDGGFSGLSRWRRNGYGEEERVRSVWLGSEV